MKAATMAAKDNHDLSIRLAETAVLAEHQIARHFDILAAAGTPERLVAAMRHATLAGGKRFRPFLVLEFARLLGATPYPRIALDVAASLECVHAYSLVHDDLPAMDNDELRRGRPTVWKAYDEWTAILAGDGLLTMAFEILVGKHSAPLPPETANRLVAELAAASGPAGMVGGQMLDLEAEKLGLPARPDLAHVRRLQGMKTGRLILYACRAGAHVAGASPADLAAASRYGAALGLAFQMADDLLDLVGDAQVVGKAVGKDQALGKATIVAALGEAEARRHLAEVVADGLAALEGYGHDADMLRAAIRLQSVRDR